MLLHSDQAALRKALLCLWCTNGTGEEDEVTDITHSPWKLTQLDIIWKTLETAELSEERTRAYTLFLPELGRLWAVWLPSTPKLVEPTTLWLQAWLAERPQRLAELQGFLMSPELAGWLWQGVAALVSGIPNPVAAVTAVAVASAEAASGATAEAAAVGAVWKAMGGRLTANARAPSPRNATAPDSSAAAGGGGGEAGTATTGGASSPIGTSRGRRWSPSGDFNPAWQPAWEELMAMVRLRLVMDGTAAAYFAQLDVLQHCLLCQLQMLYWQQHTHRGMEAKLQGGKACGCSSTGSGGSSKGSSSTGDGDSSNGNSNTSGWGSSKGGSSTGGGGSSNCGSSTSAGSRGPGRTCIGTSMHEEAAIEAALAPLVAEGLPAAVSKQGDLLQDIRSQDDLLVKDQTVAAGSNSSSSSQATGKPAPEAALAALLAEPGLPAAFSEHGGLQLLLQQMRTQDLLLLQQQLRSQNDQVVTAGSRSSSSSSDQAMGKPAAAGTAAGEGQGRQEMSEEEVRGLCKGGDMVRGADSLGMCGADGSGCSSSNGSGGCSSGGSGGGGRMGGRNRGEGVRSLERETIAISTGGSSSSASGPEASNRGSSSGSGCRIANNEATEVVGSLSVSFLLPPYDMLNCQTWKGDGTIGAGASTGQQLKAVETALPFELGSSYWGSARDAAIQAFSIQSMQTAAAHAKPMWVAGAPPSAAAGARPGLAGAAAGRNPSSAGASGVSGAGDPLPLLSEAAAAGGAASAPAVSAAAANPSAASAAGRGGGGGGRGCVAAGAGAAPTAPADISAGDVFSVGPMHISLVVKVLQQLCQCRDLEPGGMALDGISKWLLLLCMVLRCCSLADRAAYMQAEGGQLLGLLMRLLMDEQQQQQQDKVVPPSAAAAAADGSGGPRGPRCVGSSSSSRGDGNSSHSKVSRSRVGSAGAEGSSSSSRNRSSKSSSSRHGLSEGASGSSSSSRGYDQDLEHFQWRLLSGTLAPGFCWGCPRTFSWSDYSSRGEMTTAGGLSWLLTTVLVHLLLKPLVAEGIEVAGGDVDGIPALLGGVTGKDCHCRGC